MWILRGFDRIRARGHVAMTRGVIPGLMSIEAETSSRRQPHERKLSRTRIALGFVIAAWLIGQIARDSFWLTGFFFYIPSVAVAVLCLGVLLVAVWRRNRRSAITAALLMVPPLAAVLFVENQWIRPRGATGTGAPLRVVHWNVGYATYGWPGIQRELAKTSADLYVLSEMPRELSLEDLATKLGPEYSAVSLSSMVAIARGTLRNAQSRAVNERIKVFSMTWESREGPVEVFAVDLTSNPLLARDPSLRKLADLMLEHQPDIVVGDFNAPRRSCALTPPPEGFVHAYDVAGCGWSATWPLPCPVLAIDQCLLGGRIRPARYDLVSTMSSDHREQVLDFYVQTFDRNGAVGNMGRHAAAGGQE